MTGITTYLGCFVGCSHGLTVTHHLCTGMTVNTGKSCLEMNIRHQGMMIDTIRCKRCIPLVTR